ncbi:MAG: hypothetical protein LBP32_08000 [Spirochaetaceae bacterium]|nr:hypothetical protein [Spirochaetaceae bacterium]
MIIVLAILWYGLIPVAGAFISRRFWRAFRRRFDNLCLAPSLDYTAYRHDGGGVYRFIGGVESVTGQTLWIRGAGLTIPVILEGAQIHVLPMPEDTAEFFDPGQEIPQRIRWDQVSALTEGAKVFVGGSLVSLEDRLTFVSTKENPLLVIFYDGPDRSLVTRTIRAGRDKNEYLNPVTPYALTLGAFSQIFIALSFLSRPAFRLTVITAFIAVFTPLFPLIPPGLLLTILYRRLWWRARLFRAYRDLVRLPLRYFHQDEKEGRLPSGEPYGYVRLETLPEEKSIPLLIPGERPRKREGWYVFGVPAGENPSPEGDADGPRGFPGEPRDLFAVYGAVPGNPEVLTRRYALKAHVLEILSWFLLLLGIVLNGFFIGMIIFLLR